MADTEENRKPVYMDETLKNVEDTPDRVTLYLEDQPKTRIVVLKHGATILNWEVNGVDKLWLNKGSKLDGSEVVVGGIPLVFPRFGDTGKDPETDALPLHGFAHSSKWVFEGQAAANRIVFSLSTHNVPEELQKLWPKEFSLFYTITLEEHALTLEMDVHNLSTEEPLKFNLLFHTYFRLPTVEKVTVDGLGGREFWDKAGQRGGTTDEDFHPEIHQEFDRIFKKTPNHLVLKYNDKPLFNIDSANLTDTVVWNPWTKVAEEMNFVPRDSFHQMLCVEKGYVDEFKTIAPNGDFSASVKFTVL